MATTQQQQEERIQAERRELLSRAFSPEQMYGFQASTVQRGTDILAHTIAAKRADPAAHKVILAYTSNMISCGVRECLAGLISAGVVDAIVTTAGGIEEDLIKCLGPTLLGDFSLDGSGLRDNGLNRIGNLLVPNNNYVLFESFFHGVLHHHLDRQTATACGAGTCAPSDILTTSGEFLGKLEERVMAVRRRAAAAGSGADSGPADGDDHGDGEAAADYAFAASLKDVDVPMLRRQLKHSVAYQCWQHGVPILCPAFTDGSMGDMTFFFNTNRSGLVVDPMLDLVRLEQLLAPARTVGVVAVGGGLPKHFSLRAVHDSPTARLQHAVLFTTTSPLIDGCVSAGSPADDVSQELLPAGGGAASEIAHVRVEATLCFPLMCAKALFSE